MAGLRDKQQSEKLSLFRSLLFSFENDLTCNLQGAQTSLLSLRCYLEAEALTDGTNKHHLRHLRDQLDTNSLRATQYQQEARSNIVQQCVQAAGLPATFTFGSDQYDPLASLSAAEPFSTLFSLKAHIPKEPLVQSNASHHQNGGADNTCHKAQRDLVASSSAPVQTAATIPFPPQLRRQPVPPPNSGPFRPASLVSSVAATAPARGMPHDRKRNARDDCGIANGRNQWQPPAPPSTLMADQQMEDYQEEHAVQEHKDPFQTAKSKLVSDMRKKGAAYNPMEYSSGNMFSGTGPGAGPRPGLSRPAGGRSLGPRKAPGSGGVRGGFIPPFVKKGLQASGSNAGGGGEEEEGPLSARTKQLLAGPDGELPESLQRHDPQMIEQVCNDVLSSGANVTWEDIAGLETAKKLIQELVVWPMQNPHLFTGARAPPKGLLLFGPPGTGKTLVGKAIASEVNATFFNISASSLTSKWIGEGEKMVRALFAVAGCLQPAVIFIDEIDSILSMRKSDGEHEASRRLKTEMLVQMEGCDPNSKDRRVLLIGATNRPEELDEAARRRMPKQLYIPLPCALARRQMIDRQLGPCGSVKAALSDADIAKILSKTEGYSGSDMRNLIQEACQGPVRDAVLRHGSSLSNLCEDDLRAVTVRDFQVAAKAQRASVQPEEVLRYEQYNEKHGAKYVETGAEDNMDEDDW